MKLRNTWILMLAPAGGLLATVALSMLILTGLPESRTPAMLDYLGRDALPEDLPNIPAPPRSARRTLYDTLQGSQPAIAPLPPVRQQQRASDLPLLPDRRVNSNVRTTPQPAAVQPKPRKQQPTAKPRSIRQTKPAPVKRKAPVNTKPVRKQSQPKQSVRKPSRPARAADRIGPPSRAEAEARTPFAARNVSATPQTLPKKPAQTQPAKQSSKRIVPGSRRTRGKYDPSIPPTPRGEFRYFAPEYYRGIYLNNGVVRSKKRYDRTFAQSKKYGINTLVADVQPRFPSEEFIRSARENGFYLVARVVVFEGGLKQPTIPKKHLNRVLDAAERAARAGFMEIQLDYIRFADRAKIGKLGQAARYRTIAGILKMATERLRPLGVRVGADIFGRIPFNQNDRIGQRLEVFAEHMDTLYPMLYPSHFYGDPGYQKNPYKTILHGQQKTVARVGDQIKTIAYIQAFKMKVKMSGLSYHNYMVKQLEGSADSGGAGFVVWNARSAYAPFYRALAAFDKRRQAKQKQSAN